MNVKTLPVRLNYKQSGCSDSASHASCQQTSPSEILKSDWVSPCVVIKIAKRFRPVIGRGAVHLRVAFRGISDVSHFNFWTNRKQPQE